MKEGLGGHPQEDSDEFGATHQADTGRRPTCEEMEAYYQSLQNMSRAEKIRRVCERFGDYEARDWNTWRNRR